MAKSKLSLECDEVLNLTTECVVLLRIVAMYWIFNMTEN